MVTGRLFHEPLGDCVGEFGCDSAIQSVIVGPNHSRSAVELIKPLHDTRGAVILMC